MGAHGDPAEIVADFNCAYKLMQGGLTGLLFGTFVGLGKVAWVQNPGREVMKKISINYTLNVVRSNAILFAVPAAAFTGVDCAVEGLLGEKTWMSGLAGGATAGFLGGVLAKKSVPVGIFSAFALGSFMVVDFIGGGILPKDQEAWARKTPNGVLPKRVAATDS